jgi:hypothetical protein
MEKQWKREGGMNMHLDGGEVGSQAASKATSAMEAERALQNQKRESEMLRELERIISRVREARPLYAMADLALAGSNARATEVQRFICKRCGNRETELIFIDPRTGDSICRGITGNNDCGEVVQDHNINTGEAFRNFEDQEDRNHHGKVADPLMPDSVNMRTVIGGFVDGRFKYKKLQQTAMQTEMDLSNLGKEGRASTRVGYKTEHKLKAFRMMADLAVSLRIHDLVIERAKLEFARYREVKEVCGAACLHGSVWSCLPVVHRQS